MYHLVFKLLSVWLLYLYEVNCHLSVLLQFFLCVTFSNYISSLCLQYWSKLCHCWYTVSCYVTYTLSKFWLLVQCKSSYMVNTALNNYSANQEILCYHTNQKFVTVLTKNNRHLIVHQFNPAHKFHRSFSKIFPFLPKPSQTVSLQEIFQAKIL